MPSFCVDDGTDTHSVETVKNDVMTESLVPCSETTSHNPKPSVATVVVTMEDEFILDKPTIELLAERLKTWLENHSFVSQSFFARKILSRSQGTLSSLLKWRGLPTSRPGQEVWYKIKNFLEDSKQQRDLLMEHKLSKVQGRKAGRVLLR